MTRAEFVAEFGDILRLLREHAFLAYSPSGRREYEQKVRTCADYFAYLMFRKTGLPVRALPGILPIESVREASFTSARNLALRAGKKARAAGGKATGLEKEYYDQCALVWERAVARLSEPDPH